jgi:hypothetical protein
MSARLWTWSRSSNSRPPRAASSGAVLLSELGCHERAAFGHVTVDLWPYGRDGGPSQGHVSHPERSGADLEAPGHGH